MNQPSWIIGVAALVVGGAAGFAIGQSGNEAGEANAERAAATVSEAKIRRSGERGDDAGAASRRRARTAGQAMREPGQVARMQSLMDLYAEMTPAELAAEAERLESLPMGDRLMASMLLFSSWAESDPLGALAHANDMGRGGAFVKPTILRSWASLDPVNAAKYFDDNPDEFREMGWGRGRGGSGAGVIAREWAKADPDGAMAWARGLEGDDRVTAVTSVAGEMAVTDPAGAAAAVAKLDPGDRARAYGEVAEQWARQDFEAAEAWISTLTGESKDRAMAEALDVLAGSDPRAAADKVAMIADADQRGDAVRDVATSWARENPPEAAEWLFSQDAGDDRRAMRGVIGNWVRQDPAGALEFIESRPAGEGRDTAAQTYLWMNRDGDPREAVSLAETIADERGRERTVRMVADRWMDQDEAGARNYIEQTGALGERTKQGLLDGDGGRGGR